MTARGDQVQVAANAGLGRVDIAEVVRAIDDPEFLVAGGEVEDLLVLGKNNECRKAQLGAHRNDVFLGIFDHARRLGCGPHRGRRKCRSDDEEQRSHENKRDQLELIGFIVSLLWKTFLPSGNLKFGRRKIEESTEPHKGRQPETLLPEETTGGTTVRP